MTALIFRQVNFLKINTVIYVYETVSQRAEVSVALTVIALRCDIEHFVFAEFSRLNDIFVYMYRYIHIFTHMRPHCCVMTIQVTSVHRVSLWCSVLHALCIPVLQLTARA